jgi:hypothetical protein
MTADTRAAIRPLTAADAPSCDAVIRSLPYHFGDPDGQRERAEAVRASPGLVAVRDDRVVGFLTVTQGLLPLGRLPPGPRAAQPVAEPPRPAAGNATGGSP